MNVTRQELNSNLNYQKAQKKPSLEWSFIQNTINAIANTTIYYFSAKQIIRHDSFQEICFGVFPKICNVLYLNCRKLQSLFSQVVANEGTSYINSLSALRKILKENTIALSLEERSSLIWIFDPCRLSRGSGIRIKLSNALTVNIFISKATAGLLLKDHLQFVKCYICR